MDVYTLQRGLSDALNENLPAPIGDAVCLTKRELFAAMAMQGMLANPDVMIGMRDASKDLGMDSDAVVAASAREVADALLAELAKEGTE